MIKSVLTKNIKCPISIVEVLIIWQLELANYQAQFLSRKKNTPS